MTITRFLLAVALTLLLAATTTAQPNERAPRGPQDLDGDGAISRAEFDAFSDEKFELLDRNGDGVISEDEKPQRRMRRGERGAKGERGERRQMMAAGLLTHLADSDQDGTVGAGEWQDFLAHVPLGADGNVDTAAFAESLPAPPERARRRHHQRRGDEVAESEERQGPLRDRGHRVSRLLDINGDRVLEIADFEAIFSALDADQSGDLSSDEIPSFRHRGPRGG